jgi:hypothetical protein
MSDKKNKGGRPKIKRDCEMTRTLVQVPLLKTVKQMVKEYDNTKVIPDLEKRLENQNKLLLQLEKNESMADYVIATETVRAILTDI